MIAGGDTADQGSAGLLGYRAFVATIYSPAPSPPERFESCPMDHHGGHSSTAAISRAPLSLSWPHRKSESAIRQSTSAQTPEIIKYATSPSRSKLVPSAKITYTGEIGADPRNYRVKFDLLNELLPEFKLEYDLATGMEELHRKLIDHRFGKDDWHSDQFVRLRTLKRQLDLLKDVA